jgi:hypothetical protein
MKLVVQQLINIYKCPCQGQGSATYIEIKASIVLVLDFDKPRSYHFIY